MRSLGVHEHWNNPIDKQYSRNLGRTNGIELVYAKLSKTPPELTMRRTEGGVAVSWPTSHIGYHLQSADAFMPSPGWTDVADVPGVFQAQYIVSNTVSGMSRVYRLTK